MEYFKKIKIKNILAVLGTMLILVVLAGVTILSRANVLEQEQQKINSINSEFITNTNEGSFSKKRVLTITKDVIPHDGKIFAFKAYVAIGKTPWKNPYIFNLKDKESFDNIVLGEGIIYYRIVEDESPAYSTYYNCDNNTLGDILGTEIIIKLDSDVKCTFKNKKKTVTGEAFPITD